MVGNKTLQPADVQFIFNPSNYFMYKQIGVYLKNHVSVTRGVLIRNTVRIYLFGLQQ